MNRKIFFALIAIALMAGVGVAAAVVYLQSNTVGPYTFAGPVSVTLAGSLTAGQTYDAGTELVLTATLGNAATGKTVTFYNQLGDNVGSAVTVAGGVATKSLTPVAGTWSYHAIVTP